MPVIDCDPERARERLVAAGIDVEAAGVAGDTLLVVAARRDGAATLQVVEAVLDGAPSAGRSPEGV